MEYNQLNEIRNIATNFNLKALKEAFVTYIKQDQPETREQWLQTIDDAIYAAHEEAYVIHRYDEKIGEHVFVSLSDGHMKYECTMDNEQLPRYMEMINLSDFPNAQRHRTKWKDIERFNRKGGHAV